MIDLSLKFLLGRFCELQLAGQSVRSNNLPATHVLTEVIGQLRRCLMGPGENAG